MTAGRPTEYTPDIVLKAQEYLNSCVDQIEEYHSTRGMKSDTYNRLVKVRLPTKGGLAIHLGVSRETLYDWARKYPEFSDIMEALGAIQEDRLLNNGLSGDYNPTIAKVLLTKHGYREGIDQTTNDKDLPTPILGNVFNNDINKEDSSA